MGVQNPQWSSSSTGTLGPVRSPHYNIGSVIVFLGFKPLPIFFVQCANIIFLVYLRITLTQCINVVQLIFNNVGALFVGHWCSVLIRSIIAPVSGDLERTVPLRQLSQDFYLTSIRGTVLLPYIVLLPRVVDANTHTFPLVLYNNTIFRNGSAGNHVSTVPGASVHVKEFLSTTPYTYRCPVQSESGVGDKIHPQCHNIHKRVHVSIHDEQYQF